VKAVHPFHVDVDVDLDVDVVVVLAQHLHAFWTLPEGDADYTMRRSLIRAPPSRAIERGESVSGSRPRQRERGIWQRRFHEHAIRDDEDLRRHVDYIHLIQAKHGWTERPIDWPHSSNHRFVKLGILDGDWGTSAAAESLTQR
jgi:putative transposase